MDIVNTNNDMFDTDGHHVTDDYINFDMLRVFLDFVCTACCNVTREHGDFIHISSSMCPNTLVNDELL